MLFKSCIYLRNWRLFHRISTEALLRMGNMKFINCLAKARASVLCTEGSFTGITVHMDTSYHDIKVYKLRQITKQAKVM